MADITLPYSCGPPGNQGRPCRAQHVQRSCPFQGRTKGRATEPRAATAATARPRPLSPRERPAHRCPAQQGSSCSSRELGHLYRSIRGWLCTGQGRGVPGGLAGSSPGKHLGQVGDMGVAPAGLPPPRHRGGGEALSGRLFLHYAPPVPFGWCLLSSWSTPVPPCCVDTQAA